MPLIVRTATRDDAMAIARVRVDAWRAAYRGLIAHAVLDDLDAEREGKRRAERWPEFMAETRSRQFLAELDGEAVGWAAIGPSHDDERIDEGELYAINVVPRVWSTGVGHDLLLAAEAGLREAGWTRAHLWVLEGNERAASFCERHGWREDGGARVDTGFVDDALHQRRRVRRLDDPA